jgi:hypothetical protein
MAEAHDDSGAPSVATERFTGLPLVRRNPAAPAQKELTPEQVAELPILQDTEWHYAAGQ